MAPQSAIGSQMIASFSFNFLGQTIQVPAALLTHEIRGSGTWVDYAGAFYATPTQVCNYRIDYQNRGTDGRIFNTWKGSNVWDCTFGVVIRSVTLQSKSLPRLPMRSTFCKRGLPWRAVPFHQLMEPCHSKTHATSRRVSAPTALNIIPRSPYTILIPAPEDESEQHS